jgi:hypothetical protein
MKSCSGSLVPEEMQLKTTMNITLNLYIKMVKIGSSNNTKHWWRCGEIELLCISGEDVK